MSLESLFQHILSSELRAEQSRRELRGGEKGRGPGSRLPAGPGPLSSPAAGLEREEGPEVAARAAVSGAGCGHGDLETDGLSRFTCLPVWSEISRCREKIKKATEELSEEKMKLESKVQTCRACSFIT